MTHGEDRERPLPLPTAGIDPTLAQDEALIMLASIVESSDDAIISKDLDGVIRSWNRAAERIFGYTSEEAVGRPITLIIPDELLAEEQQILQKLRRGERIDHFETVRVSKSGRRLDISLTISPMRDPTGRVIGVSKVARDITEFKRTQDALARDALLLANVRDAVIMIGFDGIVNYWNEGARKLFGWTAEELLGRHQSEVFPEAMRIPEIGAPMAEAIGQEWTREFETTRKDGSCMWVDARLSVCADARGRALGFLGLANDITERRRAQEALRVADRRKDEFLALLAHELRNPLAPLRNGLHVLRLAANDARAIEQARAMMDRQLSHMVRLVDDLLDLARIGQNKVELRRTRIRIRDAVEVAVEAVRPAIEAAGHTLTVELPEVPVEVDADLTRLAQVFSNLLTNSAKYTERGGRIRLVVRRVGNEGEVAISDNGIGIPAEALPHVFGMFSQVDRGDERVTGGLGIGLALVKGFVEMHGGSVTARSEGAGRGSEFIVRLPVAKAIGFAAAAASQAGNGNAATGSPRRVLIVDDNEDAARSLAIVLELQGDAVRTARDGFEAIEATREFRPQVILMDVGMPRLSGYETARRIRAMPEGREIVIVALTGWGQDGDRVKSREAGCDGHLVKPVDLSELERLLGVLLRSGYARTRAMGEGLPRRP